MITLRNVEESDESTYMTWINDTKLGSYLSRLCPKNSNVGDYNTLSICWFIIEQDKHDIGSVWLEKDAEESNAMILGIFISEEQYRGKGIGNAIIKRAIDISKKRFIFNKVKLNVRKNNIFAIRCYEKIGFKIYAEGQKTISDGTTLEYYKMVMDINE